MTTSIIHLAVGLVLLVAVNIVLGSLNALFDGSFDKVKLRNGTIKGIIVAACFIAFYMAGWLNPDIIAIDVDGQTVMLRCWQSWPKGSKTAKTDTAAHFSWAAFLFLTSYTFWCIIRVH